GLRNAMPITFASYAIGMMALSGVPLLFSGFWSKDEILHGAFNWPVAKLPFLFALGGAFLTAFYMTRQGVYVFFGSSRLHSKPHESPAVMTAPLVLLAVCAVLLSFIGTPAWPWFERYLEGGAAHEGGHSGFSWEVAALMLVSTVVVLGAIVLAWRIFSKSAAQREFTIDPLAEKFPGVFASLRERLYVDELYDATVIRVTDSMSEGTAKSESRFFGAVGHVT